MKIHTIRGAYTRPVWLNHHLATATSEVI